MKRSEAPERKQAGGYYRIRILDITSNSNPRNPLSSRMQAVKISAWPVPDSETKSLWELGTSSEAEDRAKFVALIDQYEDGPDEIKELAASTLANGQVNAVTVREGGGGRYALAAGARRTLACLYNAVRSGAAAHVKATLIKGNDVEALYVGIAENSGRKKPNPIEVARATQRALNLNQSEAEVAEREGVSVSTVKNRLKLLRLPEATQRRIAEGTLKPSKALEGDTPKKKEAPEKVVRTIAEVKDRLDTIFREVAEEKRSKEDLREIEVLKWFLMQE